MLSFEKKWLELVTKVLHGGWDELSEVDRRFYAANHLRGSVMRGGFHSYFDNAPKREIQLAAKCFREGGAPEVAAIVGEAEMLLFPDGIPDDQALQSEQLPMWTDYEIDLDIEPIWSQELELLNHRFYALADRVEEFVLRLFETSYGAS